MRNYGMGACLLIAVATVGVALIERSNPAAAQAPMPQVVWEYKTVNVQNDRVEVAVACNEVGEKGWEMCGVISRNVPPNILIFKRLKRD